MASDTQHGRYGIERETSRAWMRPAYFLTLARLGADRSSVTFQGQVLRFTDYPFKASSVFPVRAITADRIAEVNLGSMSQVRLTSGEVLFVGHPNKEALLAFVDRFDVPVQSRTSVWS